MQVGRRRVVGRDRPPVRQRRRVRAGDRQHPGDADRHCDRRHEPRRRHRLPDPHPRHRCPPDPVLAAHVPPRRSLFRACAGTRRPASTATTAGAPSLVSAYRYPTGGSGYPGPSASIASTSRARRRTSASSSRRAACDVQRERGRPRRVHRRRIDINPYRETYGLPRRVAVRVAGARHLTIVFDSRTAAVSNFTLPATGERRHRRSCGSSRGRAGSSCRRSIAGPVSTASIVVRLDGRRSNPPGRAGSASTLRRGAPARGDRLGLPGDEEHGGRRAGAPEHGDAHDERHGSLVTLLAVVAFARGSYVGRFARSRSTERANSSLSSSRTTLRWACAASARRSRSRRRPPPPASGPEVAGSRRRRAARAPPRAGRRRQRSLLTQNADAEKWRSPARLMRR